MALMQQGLSSKCCPRRCSWSSSGHLAEVWRAQGCTRGCPMGIRGKYCIKRGWGEKGKRSFFEMSCLKGQFPSKEKSLSKGSLQRRELHQETAQSLHSSTAHFAHCYLMCPAWGGTLLTADEKSQPTRGEELIWRPESCSE